MSEKELLEVMVDVRVISKIKEREKDYGDVPLDTIVEWLLIEGFAFNKIQFEDGYIRLSSVKSLVRDLYSKLERKIIDEEEFVKAVGVPELAEKGG